MRTRTIAVAASCAAATLLSSCGIPGSSTPEVVEPAPTDFDQSSSADPDEYLPSTDATTTVQNYLRAASGDPDPAGRDDRLNQFTGGRADLSEPADGIELLDAADYSLEETSGADTITITVTVTGSIVGTYLPDGQVRMNTPPRAYEEEFVLERADLQDAWGLIDTPNQVTMLYGQFTDAYVQAPLYFQATGRSDLLVPDLRWIYGQLDEATDLRVRLAWLLQGPSEFALQSARSALPLGTTEQIVDEDDRVVIDLTLGDTTDFGEDTADAAAAQLAWSLGLTSAFELRANGETVAEGTLADWRAWNAIPPGGSDQIGYFVSDATIWQFENSEVTDTAADHPWVGLRVNGLEQVAVSPGDQIAAVVAGQGGDRLLVGAEEGDMTPVADLGGDLSDPQWLSDGVVLLIDDGALTAVDTVDGSMQVLAGEAVTALAVAPDGRRIAYVEDGRAQLTTLSHNVDGNLQIGGSSRRIGLDIGDVNDVAWSSEDFLWVAGDRSGSPEQLFRVAIDNTLVEVQTGTSDLSTVEQIAASPADPMDPNQNRGEPNLVSIGANLYRVHTSSLQAIEHADGQPVQGSAPFTVLE